ncbi:hypothetical protein [Blastococcus atacamensis]|uniref:hypothetical protein n=1 Tax=Blastococcus atacamensis TaxID=2070508 RepID=UPI000CEC990D|nr:hypothetical protein [Blastococcus atacamensis]
MIEVALPLLNAEIDEPRPERIPLRSVGQHAEGTKRPSVLHVHWFRWTGEDAFSGSSLYTCRCGQVRASL